MAPMIMRIFMGSYVIRIINRRDPPITRIERSTILIPATTPAPSLGVNMSIVHLSLSLANRDRLTIRNIIPRNSNMTRFASSMGREV
jgi:hypothetical protein